MTYADCGYCQGTGMVTFLDGDSFAMNKCPCVSDAVERLIHEIEWFEKRSSLGGAEKRRQKLLKYLSDSYEKLKLKYER